MGNLCPCLIVGAAVGGIGGGGVVGAPREQQRIDYDSERSLFRPQGPAWSLREKDHSTRARGIRALWIRLWVEAPEARGDCRA